MTLYHSQGSALQPNALQPKSLIERIKDLRPSKPLYVLHTYTLEQTAKRFVNLFPGTPLFAVKTNPSADVLRALVRGGISEFDVASLDEIKLVKSIAPHAKLHFMHTIKAPEDIHAAYFEYGVRHFVLDHEEELFKIMRETELAQDLSLTVRLTLPKNDSALIDLSCKFGASYNDAIELLKKCRPVSKQLGLSFHVGTQNSDPEQYKKAIAYCARLIEESSTEIDTLNVGGGFPIDYVGEENAPDMANMIAAIRESLTEHQLDHLPLFAEPGRVLVAKGAKLVTRVELRKGDMLYINDGIYGGLFDSASWIGTRYPTFAVSCDRPFEKQTQDFRVVGPTCDSLDMLSHPITLPADIGTGDWVVFENTGAYSQALRSDFNGFGHADVILLDD